MIKWVGLTLLSKKRGIATECGRALGRPPALRPHRSMSIEATQGLQDGPTEAAPTQNHRVTARTVRRPDGSTRTVYRVDGREVGSRAELEAVMGVQR